MDCVLTKQGAAVLSASHREWIYTYIWIGQGGRRPDALPRSLNMYRDDAAAVDLTGRPFERGVFFGSITRTV